MSESIELHERCKNAVTNILNGLSADGTHAIGASIVFPRCPAFSYIPVLALVRIVSDLNRTLNAEELTSLAVKLVNHLGRSQEGHYSAYLGLDCAAVRAALEARPGILKSRAGISAMIRAAGQDEAIAIKQRASAEVPPRRVIANFDDHVLTEITDPSHLREDGLAIGHCTGSYYDREYLASLVPKPHGRERLFALTYWRRIALGNERIFTLQRDGRPVATICYTAHNQSISEIAVTGGFSRPDGRLLASLCRALVELGKCTNIRIIQGLPASPHQDLGISTDGLFIPLRMENAQRLLGGTIKIPATANLAELDTCARNPYLTLEITNVRQRVLDGLVLTRGSLRTQAARIRLNNLTRIDGSIFCRGLETVEMRRLETIGGSLLGAGTAEIRHDNLHSIGVHNLCSRVGRVYQPKLAFIGGNNDCSHSRRVIQPLLYQARRTFDEPKAGWRQKFAHLVDHVTLRRR